jgi:hypothetical protein
VSGTCRYCGQPIRFREDGYQTIPMHEQGDVCTHQTAVRIIRPPKGGILNEDGTFSFPDTKALHDANQQDNPSPQYSLPLTRVPSNSNAELAQQESKLLPGPYGGTPRPCPICREEIWLIKHCRGKTRLIYPHHNIHQLHECRQPLQITGHRFNASMLDFVKKHQGRSNENRLCFGIVRGTESITTPQATTRWVVDIEVTPTQIITLVVPGRVTLTLGELCAVFIPVVGKVSAFFDGYGETIGRTTGLRPLPTRDSAKNKKKSAKKQGNITSSQRVKCPDCDWEVPVEQLNKHQRRFHQIRGPVSVFAAGIKLPEGARHAVTDYSKQTKPKDLVACQICGALVGSSRLRGHMARVHPAQDT